MDDCEEGDEYKLDGGFNTIGMHLVGVKETHDTEENHDGAVKAETVHVLHKDLENNKEQEQKQEQEQEQEQYLISLFKIAVTAPRAGEDVVIVDPIMAGLCDLARVKRLLEQVLTPQAQQQLQERRVRRQHYLVWSSVGNGNIALFTLLQKQVSDCKSI